MCGKLIKKVWVWVKNIRVMNVNNCLTTFSANFIEVLTVFVNNLLEVVY